MKKISLNAGDTLSLDLNLQISIPRTLTYDEDELKTFLDYMVRKFFRDPDFVKFDEVSKL